ncbi:RNA polymerase sigma factor [Spiribacter halobius]|uniref:RNA polymerase subunit sigma-24 n=1 Tax=Sediminicurvatus halobius TaxID=2182432 RepID=A0A2U2N4K8_9GAMM|nr:sigma-70 family RNA polymerase sigma factor [Spiribacter halobius]PWG63978.1 RNA polymerase subunit sigma-24 [Spiribacter halobius]
MDRLYGTALRLTRNPDDAEDVVAETVAKAWDKLDTLNSRERFEGWIFHILNNTFVSAWRRRRCRERYQAEERATTPEETEGLEFSLFERLHQPFLLWWGSAEDQFLDELLREQIDAAIDDLPDVFRIVVVLVEIQGYTYAEAATLLELPLGTIRSRLYRGRSLLQRALWEQARAEGLVTGDRPTASTGRHR